MKLDVKSLYSIYEKNYAVLRNNVADPDTAFMILNDALIYSCLQNTFNEVDVGFTFDKFRCNIKKYETQMGTPIFFLRYTKKLVEEDILLRTINSFNIILGIKKDFSISAVEEVLGNVLEQHVNRKDTGSYYTPTDTTKYITENAIFISLLNKLPTQLREKLNGKSTKQLIQQGNSLSIIRKNIVNLTKKEIDEVLNAFNDLKIIDQTCGSGAFVITAFNYIIKFRSLFDKQFCINQKVLQDTLKMLHGLDNSSEAIVLMKMRLILKVLSYGNMIQGFDDIFSHNFKVADAYTGGDFVIKESKNGKKDFDWMSFGYKFDCIIGNPPYVETNGNISCNNKFETLKCGNLYAYGIERACNTCCENGVISLIVPLSFIATPRMQLARDYLIDRSREIYISSYADRPGCIFKGVHQRLVIFTAIASENKCCKIYTTGYNFWYNDERNHLFKTLKYIENNDKRIPKIGNSTEYHILSKLESGQKKIVDYIGKGDYPIFLSSRIGFWTKSFISEPTSNEFKKLMVNSARIQKIINAFLNSSTFYLYWIIRSDCWHVSYRDYENIYFDIDKLGIEDQDKLITLNDRLMVDLEKNKKYIGSKQVDYEYKHKFSKDIIDDIDRCIAKMFAFTDKEVDYIINYTLAYRLNDIS